MFDPIEVKLSDFDLEVLEASLMHFTSILSNDDYEYVMLLGRRLAKARFDSNGAMSVRINPFNLPEKDV